MDAVTGMGKQTPSKEEHIVVSGGGMVGLSIALLLADGLPDSCSISVLESTKGKSASGSYSPSFDARSTALSYSSALVFQRLGLWEDLEPGLSAIERIHVSTRQRFGSSELSAKEQGWKALGWVVENHWLGQVLLSAVAKNDRIDLRFEQRVTGLRPAASGFSLQLVDREEHADLLIVADGANSQLRGFLGIGDKRRDYQQHALVANLAFAGQAQGIAYERFTNSGPLALLPLPPSLEEKNRLALVWSLPPSEAAELVEASDDEFASAFIAAFGQRLGRPTRVGHRTSYPLALVETREQVRSGCVILGNAAHSLHPVAGQGFNLSIRDADALARHLADADSDGASIGSLAVLNRYSHSRGDDQAQTIAASDGLPKLFMNSDPLVSLGRDLALAGLDLFPAARRQFVREAAGTASLEATAMSKDASYR
ncbi:MAG: 2-octaprenyl-6-methoxyphenyl hydroxylase [Pseudomonadota bacterium]